MFWGLIAPCIDGRTIRAAVIHNWLYSTVILSRKHADQVFLQFLIADGFTTWKAYTCYYAVRLFGSFHYGKTAISSWNFTVLVLYFFWCFILTNRKGKKRTEKHLNWKIVYSIKKATPTNYHLVKSLYSSKCVLFHVLHFCVYGAFLLLYLLETLW